MKRRQTHSVAYQVIECQVCLCEIPKSAATSDEASDYVRHFCGLECYDEWRKKNAAANDQDTE